MKSACKQNAIIIFLYFKNTKFHEILLREGNHATITIKDIADRLGIAPSTVSKGLNDANDISPDLKQLVLDTAIEMGYVTKKMKKETRKRLCIFIENMLYLKEDDFGFDIVLGFRQAAIRD